MMGWLIIVHDFLWVPENGVMVKIGGGVEPEMEFHLSANDLAVAASSDVNVGL